MTLSLSTLAPVAGARKKRIRVGRGESSGAGKTSGHGGKGQTARSGGTINAGFEGGQMPLYRRLPKYGFSSRKSILGKNRFQAVNLAELERFEDGSTVDAVALRSAGFGRTAAKVGGFKILGRGELTKKLHLKVEAISTSARAKIEALGGSVELPVVTQPKEAQRDNARGDKKGEVRGSAK